MDKRIVFSDDGTLADKTAELKDYYGSETVLPIVAAEDKLYFGSSFAFNSVYVKMNTPNVSASVVSVEYWDGGEWQSAVEVIDETISSGATFGQSGYITFVPNKSNRWALEDTVGSNNNETITGLGDITIYDKYWMRLSFTNDLDVTTGLQFVGHKFTGDDELGTEYPDLVRSNYMAAFETGKTDWDEQSVTASNLVIQDLIRKQIINSGGQLLDRHKMTPAATSKLAEIIFNAGGDKRKDDKDAARKEYSIRMNLSLYNRDENSDGRLDRKEIKSRQGRLVR